MKTDESIIDPKIAALEDKVRKLEDEIKRLRSDLDYRDGIDNYLDEGGGQ